MQKLKSGSIFVPEFQRRYVWNDGQASRLIESLIIQCPIPVIYLNQERDERLSVIDGNQRLNSLRRFLDNEFRLSGLTAYPELEGSRYFELDVRFQRHIQNRTLRCITILKETHPQVKFDVFERLNSGAVKLTPQEVRHGLYHGDAIRVAERLAGKTDFASVLDIKKDKRMKAEELVLRFLSLSEDFDNYQKPLATFISNFCMNNKSLSDQRESDLSARFETALDRVKVIFGDNAFKILDEHGKVQSRFNAALFDAQMLAVYRREVTHPEALHLHHSPLPAALQTEIRLNEPFRKALTLATSDETQIAGRVAHVEAMIDQFR